MVDNFMSRTRREFWDARGAYEKAVQRYGADSTEAEALKPRMDEAQRNLPEGSIDSIRDN